MSCTNYLTRSNTSFGVVSTANSSYSGAGATVVFTSTAIPGTTGGGTRINRIIIKAAQSAVTQGMIRLFLQDAHSGVCLFKEIIIPLYPTNPAATSGLQKTLSMELNGGFSIPVGASLLATTQNGETFNVMVVGTDFGFCGCPVS